MSTSNDALPQLVRSTLLQLGEDPGREGLLRTPERVAKCLRQLTAGYEADPVAILRSALFHEEHGGMVVVRDIEFYSLCEHHMLPFFGHVHIGYVPDGQIIGLSKLPRAVDALARRLQVQERLTVQLRRCIDEALATKGTIVVVEAQHLCMQMRGVEKQGAITRTTDFSGTFTDPAARAEFLATLKAR